MKKAVPYLFFMVLTADTYAIITERHDLRMLFKPLLMIVLSIWYRVSVSKPNYWFITALFFSFWGDVFLLFKEYFVFGLASFLVMHLLYIGIISRFVKRKSTKEFIKWLVPFLLYFSGVLYLIFDKLNELLLPVIIYGTVISAFGMISLVNYLQEKSKSNLWLFIGAILFIISDSLIAINRFYFPHIAFESLIITLYGISQYLICRKMIYTSCVLKSS
ncbi:MAG: lysoplasmalogenase [Flavobacteriaceae bacterium]|nr:lysoplasmalogenase [Flavobacteriaceae bacterium]